MVAEWCGREAAHLTVARKQRQRERKREKQKEKGKVVGNGRG